MVTTPEHAAWECSERMGRAVDQRRESIRRRRESTHRGGEEEEPEVGSQIFSPLLTRLLATDASAEGSG